MRFLASTFFIAILLFSLPISARETASPTTSSFDKNIGMVTGSATGTYYRFGKDIKDIVKTDGIDIEVKKSKGSIENINRIMSAENAALGIVQSDVLGFLKRSNDLESQKIADNLRMIFPFYREEVHVIAHKSIKNFSDLSGKDVVVGPQGSGSWLTSVNLFKIADVTPNNMLRLPPEEGLLEVLRGRADAMIFVAGKPVKLFKNLDELTKNEAYKNMVENVHFIPLTDTRMLSEYTKTKISVDDYEFVKEDVPTIAVTAVLVSYGFFDSNSDYGRSRCDNIRKVSDIIHRNIGSLKKNGHKKWSEVNLSANVGIWKKSRCSSGTSTAALESALFNVINQPDK